MSFAGPVDLNTDPELADDITAVVRGALTNVAKHAGAPSVSVDMRARAEQQGGAMSAEDAVGGGTL